jgi:hypothetical protein
MIGSGGSLTVFWSNGLVGFITTLALVLLLWPLIGRVVARLFAPAIVRRLVNRVRWARS